MLKKSITFTDINGTEKTRDYYFNLTKAEMVEFDASYPGGAMTYLNILVQNPEHNVHEIIKAFKDLILRSYGERMPSGDFVKNQNLRDAFAASEAYSELFMEITSGADAATAFITGVIPKIEETAPNNVSPIPAPIG